MKTLSATFRRIFPALLMVGLMLAVGSCSVEKYVAEGEYLLESVKVTTDSPEISASDYSPYVGQRANSEWFSLFKIPLHVYSLSGRDSTRWVNRVLRNVGEAPVIYQQTKADSTCNNMLLAMRNKGYYHSRVELENFVKGKRLTSVYRLSPGVPFSISSVRYDIQDREVEEMLDSLSYFSKYSGLHRGKQFSIPLLNDERKAITSLLNSNGYYRFNKDFIEFRVDSAANSNDVYVTLQLFKYRANSMDTPRSHPRYSIRNVNFVGGDGGAIPLREKVLTNNSLIHPGDWYNGDAVQQTYSNFARLGAVRYTNIRFTEVPDSNQLDCNIKITSNKPSTVSFQPEGTNTAGDLGAAASLTYANRNVFHGSELFSMEMRAAFEAITGLEGYQDQDYQEYSLESKLTFPRHLIPVMSERLSQGVNATSELAVAYDMQNRPEFHRRVFSGAWRYRWTSPSKRSAYRFDLLDMNYVYMPWISQTFKEDYLDSEDNRNAILRYNYEDLFIMKIGFGYNYSDQSYSLRTNMETSGNLLRGLSEVGGFKRNDQGQYTLFNIAYAQYVKGDVDYTRYLHFDENNSLALHASLGIAYPYGNSNMLPFEKRYFSGGANSVRGWSVRSLGPGRFRGTDGRIDFINQTGDMKLDMSAEYRTKLFWKFNGAAFLDAGNIWTLREYADQPGGKFRINDFYKEIAVAYGLGIRLNLGYFVIRFDFGMKAINPAYTTSKEHYPIVHPNMKRDLAVHFAVGMPF